MTDPVFDARAFHDDHNTLWVVRLPDRPHRFLLGAGNGAVTIPDDAVRDLAGAIAEGRSWSFEDGDTTLRMIRTNRGEPFREGLQIGLDGPDYHHFGGAFIDDGDIGFLTDMLAAADQNPKSPEP